MKTTLENVKPVCNDLADDNSKMKIEVAAPIKRPCIRIDLSKCRKPAPVAETPAAPVCGAGETDCTGPDEHKEISSRYNAQHITRKDEPGKFSLMIRSPQQVAQGRRTIKCQVYRTFATADGRELFLAHWKEQQDAKRAAKDAKTQAKRDAVAAFVNPYKTGDIFYSNWGYEQTNVEFFKVLEARHRSLKIVRIGEELKTDGAQAMSGEKSPLPEMERGAPVWVTIQFHTYEGKTSHSVPSPIHGGLYLLGERKSVGCSWYA